MAYVGPAEEHLAGLISKVIEDSQSCEGPFQFAAQAGKMQGSLIAIRDELKKGLSIEAIALERRCVTSG